MVGCERTHASTGHSLSNLKSIGAEKNIVVLADMELGQAAARVGLERIPLMLLPVALLVLQEGMVPIGDQPVGPVLQRAHGVIIVLVEPLVPLHVLPESIVQEREDLPAVIAVTVNLVTTVLQERLGTRAKEAIMALADTVQLDATVTQGPQADNVLVPVELVITVLQGPVAAIRMPVDLENIVLLVLVLLRTQVLVITLVLLAITVLTRASVRKGLTVQMG